MVSVVDSPLDAATSARWNPYAFARATERTREIAALLARLELDLEAQDAALCLEVPTAQLNEPKTQKEIGQSVAALAIAVQRMALIQDVSGAQTQRTSEERAAQLEGLRKMLLAMVEDVRVVLIKLAERLVYLRELAADPHSELAQRAASAVRDVFAPLANRLGVWQLKWELEDQSLRILEPNAYKEIAKALDSRKADRDVYIVEVKAKLVTELAQSGVVAEVQGRAKHITSIWNKMQRKGYRIDELYDIRAVRVLVDDLRACYTALGVVHSLWTPIPSEFDDYIARPKANHYRSLHTAVIGPDGLALEVQIRTHEMHRASEYGVAAHWRYKEGGFERGTPSGKRDADLEGKLAWLRQVLDWREQAGSASEVVDALKTNLFEDSIFVFTPQGKVIDLPKGATPIDFAYHVHTNLGHRCRGARVDGAMVPLNTPLQNGQRVEVMSAKEGAPSRDWLNPDLGYVISQRAKSKVRAWFNALAHDETVAQGRAELERFLQREGKTAVSFDALVRASGQPSAEALFDAVAKARLNQKEIVELIHRAAGDVIPTAQLTEPQISKSKARTGDSGILVVGMDRMLTGLAKCCRPAPPDTIIGFITKGAGISVHRMNCSNVRRMRDAQPERLIEAQWGAPSATVYGVLIEVTAVDREGLLRDITETLSKERINVTAMNTHNKDLTARMRFTGEVRDGAHLQRAMASISDIKGVLSVRRV
jgi:GTP pyrophosphokinase